MQDVIRTVYDDDPQAASEKAGALSPEQRARRFAAAEYVRLVREEAKARYASLPRESRRRKIREAVVRAQIKAGTP